MLVLDIIFRLAAVGLIILGLYVLVDGMKDMGKLIKQFTGEQSEAPRRQPAQPQSGSYSQQPPSPSKERPAPPPR